MSSTIPLNRAYCGTHSVVSPTPYPPLPNKLSGIQEISHIVSYTVSNKKWEYMDP